MGVIAGVANDFPLIVNSKAQAKDIARNIKSVKFDFIVSSPMSRTLDTTNIITE